MPTRTAVGMAPGTVIAFLVGRRLLPGRRPKLPVERITDDRFALILEQTDADQVSDLCVGRRAGDPGSSVRL